METLLAYNSSSDSDEHEETESQGGQNSKKRKVAEIEQGNNAYGRTNTTQADDKRLKPFVGSSEVCYGTTNNFFESNQPSSRTSGYVCGRISDDFGHSHSSASSRTNEKKILLLGSANAQCKRPNSSISGAGGARVRPYLPKRDRETLVHSLESSTSTSPLKPQLEVVDSDCISKDANGETNKVCNNNSDYVSRPPKRLHLSLEGHSQGVNCISWNPTRSHLLLTAAMDHLVCVWDTSGCGACSRRLTHHTAAVKDSTWSLCGLQVLSCGYDKTARLLSLETGQEIIKFPHQNYVTCVQFHPTDPALFLSGTFKSAILCWDTRTGNIASTYSGFFGQVQDIAFLPGGDEFISAAEVIKRNSTDKGIMVWDFRSTAVLSNQIYQEAFTCTCLKVHPRESHFVAQSNGDYIALFSTRKPFKLNKFKRYEGHKVSGYHIGCDFSPDGSIICSGSANGQIYFYDYQTSRMMRKLEAHSMPCMDIAYHPTLPHCVASCGWDGGVKVWK